MPKTLITPQAWSASSTSGSSTEVSTGSFQEMNALGDIRWQGWECNQEAGLAANRRAEISVLP